MIDAVEFKRGATLDERCRYITDKAIYYYNKIVTYDGICNEFAILKDQLDSIVNESKESIKTCNLLKSKIEQHESHLKENNQRTTEEAHRFDASFSSLKNKIEELRKELFAHSDKNSEKVEKTYSDIKEELLSYVPEASFFYFCAQTNDSIEKTQNSLLENVASVGAIKEDVVDLYEKSSEIFSRIDSLQKEIYKLQNSMVFNHSEIMKRIHEMNK